jgi:hypothetical protein
MSPLPFTPTIHKFPTNSENDMARIAAGSGMLLAALALGGCGGGGGSSDDGNIQVSRSLATIDSQSAPVIAEAVAGAIAGSESLTTIGGFSVPGVSTSFASLSKDAPQTLAAEIGPETVDCAAGGTVTLSGNVAVLTTLTVGDTLTFEFADCDDAEGVVVDGMLGFEFVAVSGDFPMGMITLTVAMTLDQLQFFEDGAGGSMNGELSFTVDTTNAPESFFAVSSSLFTLVTGSKSLTLSDFIVTTEIDPMTGTLTLDSSATLSSAAYEGELSYVTTQSLIFSGQGGPDSGQILVTGANDATLTIAILSPNQVEIEIDLDGNETVDEVIMTSWSELIG